MENAGLHPRMRSGGDVITNPIEKRSGDSVITNPKGGTHNKKFVKNKQRFESLGVPHWGDKEMKVTPTRANENGPTGQVKGDPHWGKCAKNSNENGPTGQMKGGPNWGKCAKTHQLVERTV